jgi:hypothetical protein
VISALQKRAPLKKRRGRRKKSEIAEQLLLEGDQSAEDDFDDYDESDDLADDTDDFDDEE